MLIRINPAKRLICYLCYSLWHTTDSPKFTWMVTGTVRHGYIDKKNPCMLSEKTSFPDMYGEFKWFVPRLQKWDEFISRIETIDNDALIQKLITTIFIKIVSQVTTSIVILNQLLQLAQVQIKTHNYEAHHLILDYNKFTKLFIITRAVTFKKFNVCVQS